MVWPVWYVHRDLGRGGLFFFTSMSPREMSMSSSSVMVTESGAVYLLGLVKRQEATDATEIARTTGGVRKVVRVFEYLD
jgi:osmotically-inducible protein OsmY